MKNLLLVFPFLSSCFILVQLGIGITSSDSDFKSEISTSNYNLLSSRTPLTSPNVSASLTNPFSGMIEYNTAFAGSCNQKLEISTDEGIAEIGIDAFTTKPDGLFAN